MRDEESRAEEVLEGACCGGGIWLRSKAKEGMVESERKGRGSRAEGVLERVCCGVELATGEGKGGNGSG